MQNDHRSPPKPPETSVPFLKYPEWQAAYVSLLMESDPARLPEKAKDAEAAIFLRQQTLADRGGADSEDERKALQDAAKGLLVLLTKKLHYPDWKPKRTARKTKD